VGRLLVRASAIALLATLVVVPVVLGATTTPVYGSKADDARVKETLVWITSGDHQVPGIFAVPTVRLPAAKYPAVLLLHGFASQKDEVGNMYRRLARGLAEHGIASLRVDFAGSGQSKQTFLDLTYPGMLADARAALDWLIKRPNVDKAHVGVQGFSLGSMVGATLAGTDSRIRGFASWSGAIINGQPLWSPEDLTKCEANGHLLLNLGFTKVDLSCVFFTSMAAETALTDLAPYKNPLLLVAGSADTTVDPMTSRNVVPAVHSLDVSLRIIPGADHIYHILDKDQTLANRCISITVAWWAQKL
jgi:alpha/beta superfamily hydrolase